MSRSGKVYKCIGPATGNFHLCTFPPFHLPTFPPLPLWTRKFTRQPVYLLHEGEIAYFGFWFSVYAANCPADPGAEYLQ